MFKFCLIVLLLLFVLTGCYSDRQIKGDGSVFPSERKTEPSPDFQNPYLKDFGLVRAGEIVRHSFVIKNNSSKVLNIKDVSTSCGCAVSEVKNKILNPGESTFVDVKFNSQGYFGEVQQFVYVSTDSLDESLLRFIIKANVVK